jgi:hypothetical protein
VRDALIAEGIDPLRIAAMFCYGESDLAVPTGDNVRNASNRRVVVYPIFPHEPLLERFIDAPRC